MIATAEHNKCLEKAPLTTLAQVVREGNKAIEAWGQGEWDADRSVIAQIEADVTFARETLEDTL